MKLYRETISTCNACGSTVPGRYLESAEGMWLETNCRKNGPVRELVEKNAAFFKEGYEFDAYVPFPHLVFPITYRCNLSCKFCYAHSNYNHFRPVDRSIDRIIQIINETKCPVVNLAGGEPTVRKDLPQLLQSIKSQTRIERLSIVTNGQKTWDYDYLSLLKECGMDFIFLPLYITGYDQSSHAITRVGKSLEMAWRLGIPVWVQATIETLDQMNPVLSVVEKFRRIVFKITIRAAKPYGNVSPENNVFVSDMIRFLGKENDYSMGSHPFNRNVTIFGRKAKVTSWINDRRLLDPYDARYVVHDDAIMPFHQGMIYDDLYFKSLPDPA